MKIVVDANRVIASLIKDSTTREILFNNYFEFFAPSFIKTELYKYRKEIIKKAGIKKENFDFLIGLFFEKIKIINKDAYIQFSKHFSNEIVDIKDVPYLAVCLHTKSRGIWTHDFHFKRQNKVKVFSNIDMMDIIRNI